MKYKRAHSKVMFENKDVMDSSMYVLFFLYIIENFRDTKKEPTF